jgi:hypothetical protein
MYMIKQLFLNFARSSSNFMSNLLFYTLWSITLDKSLRMSINRFLQTSYLWDNLTRLLAFPSLVSMNEHPLTTNIFSCTSRGTTLAKYLVEVHSQTFPNISNKPRLRIKRQKCTEFVLKTYYITMTLFFLMPYK